MKRILATTLVAMAAFATPAAAFAAPPTAPSGPTLTIDGKTYGPKDGLEITTVTVSAGRATATTTSARGTEVTPMATGDRFQVNHGTSYVSSYEQSLVEYVGKSYAAGNVAESKRWIQACFRYNRNGKDLVGNICSTASSASGTWRPGVVNQKTVFDSLGLNDPQTRFTYTFASVNPGVS